MRRSYAFDEQPETEAYFENAERHHVKKSERAQSRKGHDRQRHQAEEGRSENAPDSNETRDVTRLEPKIREEGRPDTKEDEADVKSGAVHRDREGVDQRLELGEIKRAQMW